ncbi:putative uncharacterized protein [Burkholderiales bacterium GJ-E10]|nr:putative uncharacterized protein [Burkholderiales bacterium GJ-E10]
MKWSVREIVAGAAVLSLSSLAVAQMGMGSGMGPGMMRGPHGPPGVSIARHRYVMARGIPQPYRRARNPLRGAAADIATGKALYEQDCASCHGTTGRGDGPVARGLNPVPSDLGATVHMPIATDAYLDWTISEGGVPIESPMPSFKASLSPEQIWRVVLYIRTL